MTNLPRKRVSVEMALCEGSPGSGFQVLLEPRRVRLVSELDNHVNPPGSVLRCMCTVSLVVPRQPLVHVARDADVIPRSALLRLEDVDEALTWHLRRGGKFIAAENAPDYEHGRSTGARSAQFLQRGRPIWIAKM